MAAFSGCRGTLYLDDGEVLGISRWSFSETIKTEEYSDNTTNCETADIEGPKTTTINFSVNLQDGAEKGKLPTRAGRRHAIELHIDDEDANFYSGNVLITELSDLEVNIDAGSKVTVSYTAKAQGGLVGNGTVDDSVSG